MKSWHFWRYEPGPACDGLVVGVGIAACVTAAAFGLGLFQFFLAVAGAGGVMFAIVSYLARR